MTTACLTGHILLTTNKLSLDSDFVISFEFAAANLPEGRDGILLLARNGKSGYFSVALVDGKQNKSQYWPRGANKHVDIAENEEA